MGTSKKPLHQNTHTSPVVTKLSWQFLTTLIMPPGAQRRFDSEAWSSRASWPGQHTTPLVARGANPSGAPSHVNSDQKPGCPRW